MKTCGASSRKGLWREGWEKKKSNCAFPWSPNSSSALGGTTCLGVRKEPEVEAEPWVLGTAGFGLCLVLPVLSLPALAQSLPSLHHAYG